MLFLNNLPVPKFDGIAAFLEVVRTLLFNQEVMINRINANGAFNPEPASKSLFAGQGNGLDFHSLLKGKMEEFEKTLLTSAFLNTKKEPRLDWKKRKYCRLSFLYIVLFE